MSLTNILLHVTGSISAFKACALSSLLISEGFSVRVSMTEAAKQFIGELSFEAIINKAVEPAFFTNKEDFIPHIRLSQSWADLILVYPATANTINRLAIGLSDDLFGALCLANNYKKPLWIAPAMNSEMFEHPSVIRSLKILTADGAQILPTEEGRLACGKKGKGRLLEPHTVLNLLKKHFSIHEENK